MNASDRSNRGGDKRMGGRGIGSKGVVSIILVSTRIGVQYYLTDLIFRISGTSSNFCHC